MSSVIEHQHVRRRRHGSSGSSVSTPWRAKSGRSARAQVGVPVTIDSGGHRSLLVRARALGARPRDRRHHDASSRHAVVRVLSAVTGAITGFVLAGVRASGQLIARVVAPAVARGTGAVARSAAGVIVFQPEDIPVHTAVLAFAVLANVMLMSVDIDRVLLASRMPQVTLPAPTELVAQSTLIPVNDGFSVIGQIAGVDPERFSRLEVTEYTVQPGETLGGLALRFGLEMDTIISFNQIEDVRRLQAGRTYQFPNRDGLLYTVKAGDSVASIAAANGSTINEILDTNDLRSQEIRAGEVLFVPGARLNQTELRLILGELFAWPTQGTFTSGFGMRADPFTGLPRFHNGIDLANRIGTPIRAAAAGTVVHIESQIGNYGRFVIVRHPDGFQTLYAHMSAFNVRVGQTISRGQVLGSMGNTGRSTGPHLHFSVIHNGAFVDPLRYLH